MTILILTVLGYAYTINTRGAPIEAVDFFSVFYATIHCFRARMFNC